MLEIESKVKRKLINGYLKWFNVKYKKRIFIAKGSRISLNLTIDYGSRINGAIVIKGNGSVSIGKYCAFGGGIRIISSNHEMFYPNIQYRLQKDIGLNILKSEKQNVMIGNNVWIGDSVIVLPGINIGDGAVIGAGSVLTVDVPSFCLYAGNPARFVKKRFQDEVSELLLCYKWWNWPLDRIKRNKMFFQTNLSLLRAKEIKSIIKE